ncbi:hypothetical protein ONE63_005117 [Megalurothrips usitatus]|uniref:C2H2-type domain-containing protein n=1 Tax=Megalurothrips usitatus TaxID=439358 RepID=A0AAV7Y0N9_9NEOP|nr:hypothetical protein ONE63_005117 [Megalurothrips usitatus]
MFVCSGCKRKKQFEGSEAFLAHFVVVHKDLVADSNMFCGYLSCFGRKFSKLNSFRAHVRKHDKNVINQSVEFSGSGFNYTSNVDLDFQQLHYAQEMLSRNVPVIEANFVNDVGDRNVEGGNLDSAAFDSALAQSVIGFISSLYDSDSFTESQIQKVIDGHMEMLKSGFLHLLKENVLKLLASSSASEKDKRNIDRMFVSCENMYEGLETHFKRQSEIEKSGAYIKPKSFSLGTALEDRVENGCVVKVPVNLIGQFIEFNDEILTYVRHLENSIVEHGPCENIIQGKLWKTMVKPRFGDKFVLPLSFSYDDYETNKELGTHTGVHNMGAGCICISCLPPKFRSQFENIFLVLLIHAGDRVKGNAETFRKVIDELKYLEEEGISVVTSDALVVLNIIVEFVLKILRQ